LLIVFADFLDFTMGPLSESPNRLKRVKSWLPSGGERNSSGGERNSSGGKRNESWDIAKEENCEPPRPKRQKIILRKLHSPHQKRAALLTEITTTLKSKACCFQLVLPHPEAFDNPAPRQKETRKRKK